MSTKQPSKQYAKLLDESLMLAKTSIAYCTDEATPSEEVKTVKLALEKIVDNLIHMKELL